MDVKTVSLSIEGPAPRSRSSTLTRISSPGIFVGSRRLSTLMECLGKLISLLLLPSRTHGFHETRDIQYYADKVSEQSSMVSIAF